MGWSFWNSGCKLSGLLLSFIFGGDRYEDVFHAFLEGRRHMSSLEISIGEPLGHVVELSPLGGEFVSVVVAPLIDNIDFLAFDMFPFGVTLNFSEDNEFRPLLQGTAHDVPEIVVLHLVEGVPVSYPIDSFYDVLRVGEYM